MKEVGRNAPCPCGSGKKYKRCCLDKPKGAPAGVLLSAFKIAPGDDFVARFLFQMSKIKSCAYPRDKWVEYDNSYSPVFQNLLEAKYAKERCSDLMKTHARSIADGKDGIYHGNQIDVRNPINDELNIFFKDFFIRGAIAMNCLIRHADYMGYNINFLFADDEKKFEKGAKKFPLQKDDNRFEALAKFVRQHRETWYAVFRNLRDKIEHEGFKLPNVQYPVDAIRKVQCVFPKLGNQEIEALLDVCWGNLRNLCEELIVFLLSLKLKDPIFILEIPEDQRDKNLPVKYAARHKAFPQAEYSAG